MCDLYQPHAYPRRSATIQCHEGRSYPMLLVEDSMTRDFVTLAPDETVGTALALCRERRIRHLPVLSEGRLVGIVSDRDLRSSTPALGDPARAAALQEVLVEDVMASEVVSAHPEDPIEQAANTMRERRIGCLPVVEDGELVGIVTASDVMDALVYLVGANEPGSRMEVAVPDRPGALAGAAGVFGMCGINIVNALALENYGFGGDHPFDPLRVRLALELCGASGLLEDYPFVTSEPATDEDLTTVHTLTYVRMVQRAGQGVGDLSELLPYGLDTPDNPIFSYMHEACARVVGGVLAACRIVMAREADHAMCISGGLHHAQRSAASGFCVYNDVGVAISRLKQD